jgi:hypothetical protein
MDYGVVEQAVVDVLKDAKLADNETLLAPLCKVYEGEFGGLFDNPEDYQPASRYALVQILDTSYTAAGQKYDLKVNSNLVCYVGSHTNTYGKAKKDVYKMKDRLVELLHQRRLFSGAAKLGTLILRNENVEFAIKNHCCISITFTFDSNIALYGNAIQQ